MSLAKPFPVIIDMLEQMTYSFWANKTRHIQVIGSLAMRAFFHPLVKSALSTGIVDIDILVSVDPVSFDVLAQECYIYLKHVLTHQGIVADPL